MSLSIFVWATEAHGMIDLEVCHDFVKDLDVLLLSKRSLWELLFWSLCGTLYDELHGLNVTIYAVAIFKVSSDSVS